MKTTSELTDAILIAANNIGARLFKNATGVAVYKKRDKSGRLRSYRVAYGVGPLGGGGGDLLGWCADGKFASIEIKLGRDTQTDAQRKWQRWVIEGGGRAGVARSVEDAIRILTCG